MKTKENGVTLIALVITIILILILASLGTTIGTETINSTAFTQFKAELKIMQDKVNELNQENKIENGRNLTENEQENKIENGRNLTENEQEKIFNNQEISDIIFNSITTEEEKNNIKNGFRYLSKGDISDKFGLDGIKRDYVINIEYRYVIYPYGFEYEGNKYYMIDQIDGEIYNVRYHNKNDNKVKFEVNVTNEKNKCKIEITNIKYNGYVDKWQVKYKLDGNSYWETSNDLTFYIKKEGTYAIKVVHGDEIDSEEQKIRVLYDGTISEKVRSNVIKIGDYVQYIPDTVSTTDEKYTNLISELGTYSGSTENTTKTLTQESLNWRVLDIVNGEVRLISETPTEKKIKLYGAKGYNNAVYLLDKACDVLYSNSEQTKLAQNLKLDDVKKYFTYDYTEQNNPNVDTGKYGGIKTYTDENYRYYPKLFSKEKTGCVDGIQGTELDLSEQTEPINEEAEQAKESITVTQTYWEKKPITNSDFNKEIYYKLFINNEKNYENYWLSTRSVHVSSGESHFRIRLIYNGYISNEDLYYNNGVSHTDGLVAYAFRPVITLNSDVQIDAKDTTKDGTTANNAYILK